MIKAKTNTFKRIKSFYLQTLISESIVLISSDFVVVSV